MGSSFLTLTNKVLARLNEVRLSDTNFVNVKGFHSMVKDAVNSAIRDINHSEQQWPFNYTTTTNVLTVGQGTYAVPDDCGSVDWSSFSINRDATLGISASALRYVEYSLYQQTRKIADENDGEGRTPQWVYRTSDNGYGVSPRPDQAYIISYGYWAQPADLVEAADTTTIPSQFDYVIVDRALFYAYSFREQVNLAATYNKYYDTHRDDMRRMLIRPPYQFTDTRVSAPIVGFS